MAKHRFHPTRYYNAIGIAEPCLRVADGDTVVTDTIDASGLDAREVTWPRGETSDDIFTIGNARPLDQALQHATTEMSRWLGEDYGLDARAASHLMGQVVRYDVGNVFNPAFTVACRIAKRWLPKR
jgi:acetamidase/formamidase